MSGTDVIRWVCPKCGHAHKWEWDKGEASPGQITAYCEGGCGKGSKMEMHRIGPRHYTAIAAPRSAA